MVGAKEEVLSESRGHALSLISLPGAASPSGELSLVTSLYGMKT